MKQYEYSDDSKSDFIRDFISALGGKFINEIIDVFIK